MGRLDKDADGWYLDPQMKRLQYQVVSRENRRWPDDGTFCEMHQKEVSNPETGNLSLILEVLGQSLKEMSILQEEIVSLRKSVLSLSKKRTPKGSY